MYGYPPRLMMRLRGPCIHSIILFCQHILPKPRYMLQWAPTWNRNELGMPRSFLLSWCKIPALVSRFSCFLNLGVTQQCKGEKERGASNIGNFYNKNKHNISLIIIPLPTVSLNFSTGSESYNWSSSIVTHSLNCQHHNTVAAPPPAGSKASITKIWYNRLCWFMAAGYWKPGIFLTKTISSLDMKWRVCSHRCPEMVFP